MQRAVAAVGRGDAPASTTVQPSSIGATRFVSAHVQGKEKVVILGGCTKYTRPLIPQTAGVYWIHMEGARGYGVGTQTS
jgi:hypothetical protein